MWFGCFTSINTSDSYSDHDMGLLSNRLPFTSLAMLKTQEMAYGSPTRYPYGITGAFIRTEGTSNLSQVSVRDRSDSVGSKTANSDNGYAT